MKTFLEFLEEKGFVFQEGKKKKVCMEKKSVNEKKGLDKKKKSE